MEKIELVWQPEAAISVSGLEISILIDAARAHYDSVCRQAARSWQPPEKGGCGFLIQWAQRWNLEMERKHEKEFTGWTSEKKMLENLRHLTFMHETCEVNFVQLERVNLCMKILEYRGSLEVPQQRDDLRRSMRELFEHMNGEWQRLNHDAMERSKR